MPYSVYMLRCSDNSYYTGITSNVPRRVVEHGEGKDPSSYTFSRRPIELVYQAEFHEVTDAISWEKRVKGWSRKKKEALITGGYEELPGLSKNQYRKRIDYTIQSIRYACRVMLSPSKHGHGEDLLCRPSTGSG